MNISERLERLKQIDVAGTVKPVGEDPYSQILPKSETDGISYDGILGSRDPVSPVNNPEEDSKSFTETINHTSNMKSTTDLLEDCKVVEGGDMSLNIYSLNIEGVEYTPILPKIFQDSEGRIGALIQKIFEECNSEVLPRDVFPIAGKLSLDGYRSFMFNKKEYLYKDEEASRTSRLLERQKILNTFEQTLNQGKLVMEPLFKTVQSVDRNFQTLKYTDETIKFLVASLKLYNSKIVSKSTGGFFLMAGEYTC